MRILLWPLVVVIFGCHPTRKVETISVGVPLHPCAGLIIIAQEEGFFASEDLKVKLHFFDSGKEASAALFNDKVDLAGAYGTVIVFNNLYNKPQKILSSLHISKTNSAIVVRRDRDIETPQDLVGKTIGVVKESSADYFLNRWLFSERIDVSKVKIKYIRPIDASRFLEMRELDAISTWDPHIAGILQLAPSKVKGFYSDVHIEHSVLIGNELNKRLNDDLIFRFLSGLRKAEQRYRENRSGSEKLVEDYLVDRSLRRKPKWSTATLNLAITSAFENSLRVRKHWLMGHKPSGDYNPKYTIIDQIKGEPLRRVDPYAVTYGTYW